MTAGSQSAGAGVEEPGSVAPAADAVARYCAASERADIDGIMATLAADAALVSPLSGRMVFSGAADVRLLAAAVYPTLKDLRWGEPMGEGTLRSEVGTCRVGPLRLDDAMVLELDSEGLICRVRPHLRPWLGTTLFALLLGPKMATHPGVIWRALRSRR